MSIGFRKGLFGFNCDDVMSYIESTHKTYVENETLLKEKAEELETALNSISSELEAVKAEKEILNRELKEYTDKYDEIERLSRNIGKLYIVAQSNARAIMKNSENNLKLSRSEVEKNLSSIDEAHKSLDTLKADILKTSSEFACKVEQLLSSLVDTREKIRENDDMSEKSTETLNSLYAEIVK